MVIRSVWQIRPIVIEEATVAKAARKAIEAVREQGVKIQRRVGNWCMMKPGKHTLHELQNTIITITNPVMRWNSRVNAGMLTETLDYFLGLNPGFTHKSTWRFYKKWIDKRTGKYPYTYGLRVFGTGTENEIDQWKEAVKLLKMNPTTRHAHITIGRPIDLLREFIPCNFAWHFQVDNQGRLNMITFCRSQDAMRGLFLDLFAYAHFLEQMALATNLPLGTYTVYETNLHIYNKDLDKIETEFAKPTEPYTESIAPKGAPLLTDKDKKVLHNLLVDIFEHRRCPRFDEVDLNSYWKDWVIFIATIILMKSKSSFGQMLSRIESREIEWTLRKNLKSQDSHVI